MNSGTLFVHLSLRGTVRLFHTVYAVCFYGSLFIMLFTSASDIRLIFLSATVI